MAAALDKDPASRSRAFPRVPDFVAELQAAASQNSVDGTPWLGTASVEPDVPAPPARRPAGVLIALAFVLVRGPVAFVVAADCATAVDVDSTWSEGPLACYDNNVAVAAVWFGYADSGLNVVAVREDGENVALYRWFAETDWSSPRGPGS